MPTDEYLIKQSLAKEMKRRGEDVSNAQLNAMTRKTMQNMKQTRDYATRMGRDFTVSAKDIHKATTSGSTYRQEQIMRQMNAAKPGSARKGLFGF